MTVAAGDARVKAEAEQIRSTLLSSLSHDLKTPLAAIAGASSSLLQKEPQPDGTRRELLETISEEATRLTRLLDNIGILLHGEWKGRDSRTASDRHRNEAATGTSGTHDRTLLGFPGEL